MAGGLGYKHSDTTNWQLTSVANTQLLSIWVSFDQQILSLRRQLLSRHSLTMNIQATCLEGWSQHSHLPACPWCHLRCLFFYLSSWGNLFHGDKLHGELDLFQTWPSINYAWDSLLNMEDTPNNSPQLRNASTCASTCFHDGLFHDGRQCQPDHQSLASCSSMETPKMLPVLFMLWMWTLIDQVFLWDDMSDWGQVLPMLRRANVYQPPFMWPSSRGD